MNVVQPIRGEKGATGHRNSLGNEAVATSNQVTSASHTISFPVGYHNLHPDISINFQLNRFYGWVGDESMLTEMREAAAGLAGVQRLSGLHQDIPRTRGQGARPARDAQGRLLFAPRRVLSADQGSAQVAHASALC